MTKRVGYRADAPERYEAGETVSILYSADGWLFRVRVRKKS